MIIEYEGSPEPPRGFTVKDVSPDRFVRAYAEHLKKSGKVSLPAWVDYVKTSKHKELTPYDGDWYYIRMASVARRIYVNEGLGVGALARAYGGPYRPSVKPQKHVKASRKVLRHVLSQLQNLDILETQIMENTQGVRVSKGRRVTRNGRRELDRIARQVAAEEHGEEETA